MMQEYNSENDKEVILNAYKGLLKSINNRKSPEDTKVIRKAFNIANEAHKDMRRKSGEPYITHPIEVARICAEEMGLGTTTIACALLHDTVEDTDITLENIENTFGKKVRIIIDGLTKISGVFDFSTSDQAESFRKMLLTLPEDVRVIFIKLADRLHNMRTLGSMRVDKQFKIASETLFLYAPLAHRLGLYNIKTELEDLSLKYKNPVEYQDIRSKLNATKEARQRFIGLFITPIKKALTESGLNFEIKSRTKSIHSIWNKIRKKNVSFEEIYDLFAIRIIIDTDEKLEKSDCWKAYSIVTDFYKPNPDRLRDWITTPKGNGYESLHTTVMSPSGKWVEVQIRTKRMDEIAEKGLAAHWKYKGSSLQQSNQFDEWINKIRDLIENRDTSNTIDFIDDFKLSLFAEEIYIFTPKGEIKTLPNGATALDFAFDIHSEIGKKCIGAKVNYKLVPLSHKLKSGDQVEIITSNKQTPKEAWLDFVITSKAKSRIKHSLREIEKKIALQGKEILYRKLKNLDVKTNDKNIDILLKYFKYPTALDFYYDIALNKIKLQEIKPLIQKGGDLSFTITEKTNEEKLEETIQTLKKGKKGIILDNNNIDMDYTISKCCNPIPGDDIFGFITINDGVKIHNKSCPNAIQLFSKYAYRIIPAYWKLEGQSVFVAKLQFEGIDDVGVLNQITNVISKNLNIDMKSVSFSTNDGVYQGRVEVIVSDNVHLNNLIVELKKIEGLKYVYRVETFNNTIS